MNTTLPAHVKWVLDTLSLQGYEAYAVGGCVRDLLLGHTPHDWDVCTNATPDGVIACFPGTPVIKTGIRHGTVTVLSSGLPIEVTTYREDGVYSDHRRPDAVRFTGSLKADLSRRDFTINAMAFRPGSGLVDYYGGRRDLADGIVRCVGEAGLRLEEDALRILRALRFSSRLRFTIEPETADALLEKCGLLRYVAVERVLAELRGMDYAALEHRFLPVLQAVIPELKAIDVPMGLPDDDAIRLAALLHGLDARAVLSRLKASNALTDRVCLLASEMDSPPPHTSVAARRLLHRTGPEAAGQLVALWRDDEAGRALTEVLQRGDCYRLGMLQINGNDLNSLGMRGEEIGDTLEALLSAVIEGTLANDRASLLEAAGGR